MQKKYSILLLLSFLLLTNISFAQLTTVGNAFLQGHWLEIGLPPSGVLGATRGTPTGYHAHPGGSLSAYAGSPCTSSSSSSFLGSVYDFGHDGWATGSPHYTGDYTLPGSPWEEWGVEVGGVNRYANFIMLESSCTGYSGSSLSGSFSSFTNTAGVVRANWSGSAASGNLSIKKEYRLDTEASAMVVTVRFDNITSSTLTGIYYFRACDPDNDETWPGGSFETNNTVNYVSSLDYYHRAEVTATGTHVTGSKIGLGTKDCRAKAMIFSSWGGFSYSTNMASIYAGTASAIGPSYYQGNHNGDIAIGLIYKLGDLPAGDSMVISYAYIFNGAAGLEDAFPTPKMVIDGVAHDSTDTVNLCSTGLLNVGISHANEKDWTWSSWTWSPSIGLASDTGINNTVDANLLTGTTVYTIVGTDSLMGNCNQRQFVLTVNPIYSPRPVVSDTVLCLGISAPPLSAIGTSLLWYTDSVGGTGVPSITPSTSTLGVDTYYVSQTVDGCESPRAALIVTIQAPPSITVSNNTPLCPGDNLILTVIDTLTSGGITYSWIGPDGFTSTEHNPFITGVVYADSGVYTVVVDNNGCVSYPTSTTAVIHSTPPNPIAVNPVYCQYLPSVALSAIGSNILWYNSAIGGFGSTTAPIPSTTVAGTFTYYVTQTINGCESARQPVVVTVHPKPNPPIITDAPGSYCPGQPFNPFTVILGTGILWFNAASGGVGVTVPPTISTSVPGLYPVWASQTVLGCESDRSSFTVTIYPYVTSGFDTFIHHGCTEDTVIFNNTSTGAVNYLWDFGDGTSSSLANPVHTYTTQANYIVKLFSHSETCVDSTIDLLPLIHPINAAFVFEPSIVCQGLPATFRDTSLGASPHYFWTFGDGDTSTAKDPIHIYSTTGTDSITLFLTDDYRCTDTARGVITIDSVSSLSFTISDTVICLGTHVTMAAEYSHSGNVSLIWNLGNGDSVLGVDPYEYAYPVSGSFDIVVTAHYRACPDASSTKHITIFQQPVISLGGDTTICSGGESILLADITNAGNPAAHWLWNTGQTTSSINVIGAGGYEATVTIGGCSASDSVNITDDCALALPNIFSPNGDGINDYWNPRTFFSKGLKTFSLTVYNRWGQIVFQTNSLEGSGWDGKFNNAPQPEGVYIYTLEATFNDGQNVNKQGNMTLLR